MKSEHIQLLNSVFAHQNIQQGMNKIIDELNENNFFQLNFLKTKRIKELASFYKTNAIRNIFLTQRLNKIKVSDNKITSQILADNFFTNAVDFQSKLKLIENSIVIVNNNDVHVNGDLDLFKSFVDNSNNTIFCAWDWDNHHWLSLSCPLAGLVDIYTPSHNENLYQLSRFNSTATNVIPCATVQWSKDFLIENNEKILTSVRSDELLGMHIPYSIFKYRIAVINKISETCPKVGFSSAGFHEKTEIDKLNEWASYKAHLIVPVLNDIPIRVFDALSTGGIPLLPESLRGHMKSFKFDNDDVAYYDTFDVLNIHKILNEILLKFDQSGVIGIRKRIDIGTNIHHGNNRIRDILSLVELFAFEN